MKNRLGYGTLLTILMIVTAVTVLAQGPLLKRVNFSISSPFALRMGDYLVPPGNYVLKQVLQNDTNLFALHPQDLTNEPIAMIRTVRIEYPSGRTPDDTKLFVELDERSPDIHPVLQGWTIPGMDGWEVIGVVEKKSGVLAKIEVDSSGRYKFDKTKVSFTKYDKKDKRSKIKFVTINDH